jgi:hypothetical protein
MEVRVMPSLRPKTRASRELLQEMQQEFTVAEYNYLLEGTEESLIQYRQARAWISYLNNIQLEEANVS